MKIVDEPELIHFSTEDLIGLINHLKEANNKKAYIIMDAYLRDVDFQTILSQDESIFKSIKFINCDLSFCDLRNIDFRRAVFADSKLIGANLDNADLEAAKFLDSEITDASLKNVRLNSKTRFKETPFTTESFIDIYFSIEALDEPSKKGIKQKIFKNADLSGVDFQIFRQTSQSLTDFSFKAANFENADFRGINLINVNFNEAGFYGDCKLGSIDTKHISLEEADLSHISIDNLEPSRSAPNTFRQTKISTEILISILGSDYVNGVKTSLKEINFSEVNFKTIIDSFSAAALDGYDLSYSDLSGADLASLDISNTKLEFSSVDEIIVKNTMMNTEQFGFFYRAGIEDFSNVILIGEPTLYLTQLLLDTAQPYPLTELSLSNHIINFLLRYDLIKIKQKKTDFNLFRKLKEWRRKVEFLHGHALNPRYNDFELTSLIQSSEEHFSTLTETINTIHQIKGKASDKKYLLTNKEKKTLTTYERTLKETEKKHISIVKTDAITRIDELISVIDAHAKFFFILRISPHNHSYKTFYIYKRENKYSITTNHELIYLGLSKQDFIRLMNEYFNDYNFFNAFIDTVDPFAYHEFMEGLEHLGHLKTENLDLRRQDQAWGELRISNSIKISRELLYSIGLLIKDAKGESQLLSGEMEMTQKRFDEARLNNYLTIDLEIYFEQLSLAVEKGNNSKVQKLINLYLANEISFSGNKNFQVELGIHLDRFARLLNSGLVNLDNINLQQRREIASHFFCIWEFYSFSDKKIYKSLLKKNQLKILKARAITYSEQLLFIKAVFDVFKGAIFNNKNDLNTGITLYFVNMFLIGPLVDFILHNHSPNLLRKSSAVIVAAGLDLITIGVGMRALSKQLSIPTLVDVGASGLLTLFTIDNIFNHRVSTKGPFLIMLGTVFAKGVFSLFDNRNYHLTHSEKLEDFFRVGFDIPNPKLDAIKKEQRFLDVIYEAYGLKLTQEQDIGGLAYGLGNKANANTNWQHVKKIIEKVNRDKSQMHSSRPGKLAKVGRKSRYVKSRFERRKFEARYQKWRRTQDKEESELAREKYLASLPKPAETNMDLTHNSRSVWASRHNPPSALTMVRDLEPRKKNWAQPNTLYEDFSIPAYFPACYNEDPDGARSSTSVFVSSYNVYGQCTNAIVIFSRDMQQAINRLGETLNATESTEIIKKLQAKEFRFNGEFVSSGTIKGLDIGPKNFFEIGEGNATYLGSNSSTKANIFHLPTKNYVGNIIGGIGSVENVLDASQVSGTRLAYDAEILEDNSVGTRVFSSGITHYQGRRNKQDLVDCLKNTQLYVKAQGGSVGFADQLFSCKHIMISGYSDVASDLADVHRVDIEPESKGPITIHYPQASEIIIVFPNITNLVSTGKFFYYQEKKELKISNDKLTLILSPYEEEETRFKFMDQQGKMLALNNFIPHFRKKRRVVEDVTVFQPLTDTPIAFLEAFTHGVSQEKVAYMAYIGNETVAMAGTSEKDLLMPVPGVRVLAGNLGEDVYSFSEAYLDYLKKNQPLIITNYSKDRAIDTLKFACSIKDLFFKIDGLNVSIYHLNTLVISIKDYFLSDSNQHLILEDNMELTWIFSLTKNFNTSHSDHKESKQAYQHIKLIPFYGKNTHSVITIESLSNTFKVALAIDPNELIAFRSENDLLLANEQRLATQFNVPFTLLLEDFFVNPRDWKDLVLVQAEKGLYLNNSGPFEHSIKGETLIKLAPLIKELKEIKSGTQKIDSLQFPRFKPERRTTENSDNPYSYLDHDRYKNYLAIPMEAYLDLSNITQIQVVSDSGGIKISFFPENDISYLPMIISWRDSNKRIQGIIKDETILVEGLNEHEDAISLEKQINEALLIHAIEKQQLKFLTPIELLELKGFVYFYNFEKSPEELLAILNFQSLDKLNEFLGSYTLLTSTSQKLQRFRQLWKGDKASLSYKALLWQSILRLHNNKKTHQQIINYFNTNFRFLPKRVTYSIAERLTHKNQLSLDEIKRNIDYFRLSDTDKDWLKNQSQIVFYELSAEDVTIIRHNQPLNSQAYKNLNLQKGFIDASSLIYTDIQVAKVGDTLEINFLKNKQTRKAVKIEDWSKFDRRINGIIDGKLFIDGLEKFLDAKLIQAHIDRAIQDYHGGYTLEKGALGSFFKQYTFFANNRDQEEVIYHNQLTRGPHYSLEEVEINYPGCIRIKNFLPIDYETQLTMDMVVNFFDKEGHNFRITIKNWALKDIHQVNNIRFDRVKIDILTGFSVYYDDLSTQPNPRFGNSETMIDEEQMLGDQPLHALNTEVKDGYSTEYPQLKTESSSNSLSSMSITQPEFDAILLTGIFVTKIINRNKDFKSIPKLSIDEQQEEKLDELEVKVKSAIRDVEKNLTQSELKAPTNAWGNWPLMTGIISAVGIGISFVGGILYYLKRRNTMTKITSASLNTMTYYKKDESYLWDEECKEPFFSPQARPEAEYPMNEAFSPWINEAKKNKSKKNITRQQTQLESYV